MIWKIIANVKAFLEKCRNDKINAYAAQSAFFIIVSIIPLLMVFSSLLQYTSITESLLMKVIHNVMPDYIAPFLISLVHEVYSHSVGLISATAFAALWSAAKGFQYMADGLNAVHRLSETRNWLMLRLSAVIYTIVFLVAIVIMLAVAVFGNSIQEIAINYFPLLRRTAVFGIRFRWVIVFVGMIILFDVLFTTLPNRKLTFKSQLPGAVVCGVVWALFSFGLSVYVTYFNGFSMYGSLTTIVLVMLWLYFCMYILMMSAEINVVFYDSIEKWLLRDKKHHVRGRRT